MKSRKATDSFDQLIEAAIPEIHDNEGAEFDAIDDRGVELSDRITQKIEQTIRQESNARTIKINQWKKLLPSAALIAIVTVCVVWMAMTSAFGKLPPFSSSTEQTTDSGNTSENSDYSESTETTSGSDQQTSVTDKPISGTTPTQSLFEVPPDEKQAVLSIFTSNADGLKIELRLHGYRSASLNKSFYAKNNEYLTVEIKITNESSEPVYQFLPTSCVESMIPHNHEIGYDISSGEYDLYSSSFGFDCVTKDRVWTLEPGKTYEWTLRLAAGEESASDPDLPADGGNRMGIKLYDENLYTDGSCIFNGKISFSYGKTQELTSNNLSLSVPITVEIVRIKTDPDTSS